MFPFFHSRELPELFWHTDIHSHVCPGIDDGSPSPEKSVMLVEAMAGFGFTRMIVTPHVTDETFPNTPDVLADSYRLLTEACREAGLPMQFGLSAEYRIDDMLLSLLGEKNVRPLPGGYLLVENSWLQEPPFLDDFLFQCSSTYGYRPVLAHPERYRYYRRTPQRYKELHDKGVLFQVNLLSLAGHYGREERETARWLLERDMVSFIGSDLHRMGHIEAIRDYLCSRAYRALEAKSSLILNDKLTDNK